MNPSSSCSNFGILGSFHHYLKMSIFVSVLNKSSAFPCNFSVRANRKDMREWHLWGSHSLFLASLLALCVGRRRPLSYALGITFLRLVAEVRPATTALSPVKMAPDLTHTTTKNAHGNQLKNDSCPIQKLESLFNHFH